MPKPPKISSIWPIFAILVVVLVFFYPVWLKGLIPLPLDALVGAHIPWTEVRWEGYPTGVPIKNLEITDSISQFYPWRALVGEFWRARLAPLWNPYMLSGTPLLATLHSAALYPLNILYVFLGDQWAWTGLIILQILLAGLFMYLFLRSLGLWEMASLLGAIAFAFSGYMIAWLEFATGGQAGLWLPLLLLFEYKLINTARVFWLLPITVVFFFIYTAGDFQVPIYISLTYLAFGAFLVLRKRIYRLFWLVFGGILFGVLVSLPQFLPSLELFASSIRRDDPYIWEYFFGLMHWEKIVNFIWPDFFGNVTTGNYWGKFGFHEYLAFVGVVPLIFAIYGLFNKKTAVEKFFWVLLGISLLFLFPTPLGFLPYKLGIPGLGTSSASRIIYLVDFCLVTLSAFGFSKWRQKQDLRLLKLVVLFLAVTAGIGLGLISSIYLIEKLSGMVPLQITTNLKVSFRNMVPTTMVLISVFGLLLANYKIIPRLKVNSVSRYFSILLPVFLVLATLAELLRFGWKNTSFSPKQFLYPKTQILEFLQKQPGPFRIAGGIPTNLFMPFKIQSAEGYDPIYFADYARWLSRVNFGHPDSPSRRYGLMHSFSSDLINYANVEYVIDYKKDIYGNLSERGNFAPGIELPRYQPVFSEGRVVVFRNTQNLPRVWLSSTWGKKIEYEVSDFKESYNSLEFGASAAADGIIFLSQSFVPGWRAFVDEKEVEISRANYVFQSIAVPKGDHEVEFIYEPQSFKIGAGISLATATFFVVILLYEKFAKRSRKIT